MLTDIGSNSNSIFEIGKQENKYGIFIRKSIDYFKETNNIVEETKHPDKNWTIYKIEKHNVEDSYKKIPLNVEGNKVDLILNKSNLYVDGIITHNNGTGIEKRLWYFSDSNLDKNSKSLELKDKNKLFSKILDLEINSDNDLKNLTTKLDFDSNYQTLTSGDENIKINKENIRGAIINLSNISDTTIDKINKNKKNKTAIKEDFLRTIFITSEATRFFSVRSEVNKILTSSGEYEINWQNHKDKLTSWDKNSQKYYEIKMEQNLLTKKNQEYMIFLF
ncbi:MAG: hypothetical protein CXB60_11225 [Spiroplasma poulsonii]|nr:hypothetical protein [Spiroplasma poulsonii]